MPLTIDPRLAEPAPVNISQAAPELLRTLFLHHDGIVLGATIAALHRSGLLDDLLERGRVTLPELLQRYACNPGYLQVALRCLALQGWLERHGEPGTDEMQFVVTPAGRIAAEVFPRYAALAACVYTQGSLDRYFFAAAGREALTCYARLVEDCVLDWRLPPSTDAQRAAQHRTSAAHLDGMLAGPWMVAAKMRGLLEGEGLDLKSLGPGTERLRLGSAVLRHLGWIDAASDRPVFTEVGKLACRFSLHYGLTLSYYPMLARLERLVFTAARHVTHVEAGQDETHVDRVLNVLASGVAHRRYFEDSDRILIEVFDREPLAAQPRFVADMGCGDGAWLKRIYQVVRTRCLRGRHLDTHPLLMIAADYNLKALEVARHTLSEAQVPHLGLLGDVTDPERFERDLVAQGIDIRDGLHIRAFIDHNRRYTLPEDRESAARRRPLSSGAYAEESGAAIPNALLEQGLLEHLRRWAPYVERHGLVIIEAHNVDPTIAAQYNGRTHATAFDTYHGFSNQYPLDFEAFMRSAEEAGLRAVPYQQVIYPATLPFVAISLNRFKTAAAFELPRGVDFGKSKSSVAWSPDGSEDVADGEALHRFLYEAGDLTRPRRWCYYATARLVERLLEAVERRLAALSAGRVSERRLRVVDYGAGTGLASVELIKGLHETGLLGRMRRERIELELLLLDFPSGWFAKSKELLDGYSFVRWDSLRDPGSGAIRPLTALLGHAQVDIVFASMVLHLVPPQALPMPIEQFAEVLKGEGVLLWNAPDLGPAPAYAVGIHAANRRLRRRVLECIDDDGLLPEILSRIPAVQRDLPQRLQEARRQLTPALRDAIAARAGRQVLPEPNDLQHIRRLLATRFSGDTSSFVSVLSSEDVVALALLPSNQRCFGEVQDRATRERLIRFLLRAEVLPALRATPAGNPLGLNLHWTAGRYVRRR